MVCYPKSTKARNSEGESGEKNGKEAAQSGRALAVLLEGIPFLAGFDSESNGPGKGGGGLVESTNALGPSMARPNRLALPPRRSPVQRLGLLLLRLVGLRQGEGVDLAARAERQELGPEPRRGRRGRRGPSAKSPKETDLIS